MENEKEFAEESKEANTHENIKMKEMMVVVVVMVNALARSKAVERLLHDAPVVIVVFLLGVWSTISRPVRLLLPSTSSIHTTSPATI